MKLIYPTCAQVVEFHRRIIAATGGCDGLRSTALTLDGAADALPVLETSLSS